MSDPHGNGNGTGAHAPDSLPLERKLPLLVLGLFTLVLGFGNILWAQPSLTIASASATTGSPISVDVALSSPAGSEPSALQWNLTYSPGTLANVSVVAGPSMGSAGKTISCSGQDGSYLCLAYGMNATPIANGVVASVTATVAGSAGTPILVSNIVAADPDAQRKAAEYREQHDAPGCRHRHIRGCDVPAREPTQGLGDLRHRLVADKRTEPGRKRLGRGDSRRQQDAGLPAAHYGH